MSEPLYSPITNSERETYERWRANGISHNTEIEIARMRGEIAAIDTRINRAWEGIKADLARQEWLRQQIIRASAYTPNTDFNLTQPAASQAKS